MARAIELAGQGDFRTSPNPMVGAVVIDPLGRVLGEGFHHRAGEGHAEVLALAQAGAGSMGADLFVSLEPCNHSGTTPPCTEAIIQAGIRRVVVAIVDPDVRVAGAGIARLREAGLDVIVGPGAGTATRLNEFYIRHRTSRRPFVSSKFAMSLDGKIATRSGESRWITGPQARLHGHGLRHKHDAVMVGARTVIVDDPVLTTRIPDRPDARQPLRIVLDAKLRIPATARIVNPALPAGGEHSTLIATVRPTQSDLVRALEMRGAEVVLVKADGTEGVDLLEFLNYLGSRNVISVLVEGGSNLHGRLFAAGLVDRVWAYVAPKIIGGSDAPTPVGAAGIDRINDALRLSSLEILKLGEDILITGLCSPG
jgi:diaminohydroxyphosphoribosylaminopyrimidine deaminase/5-amino-6-(5-phosphoribosylamino)uracil reductase